MNGAVPGRTEMLLGWQDQYEGLTSSPVSVQLQWGEERGESAPHVGYPLSRASARVSVMVACGIVFLQADTLLAYPFRIQYSNGNPFIAAPNQPQPDKDSAHFLAGWGPGDWESNGNWLAAQVAYENLRRSSWKTGWSVVPSYGGGHREEPHPVVPEPSDLGLGQDAPQLAAPPLTPNPEPSFYIPITVIGALMLVRTWRGKLRSPLERG